MVRRCRSRVVVLRWAFHTLTRNAQYSERSRSPAIDSWLMSDNAVPSPPPPSQAKAVYQPFPSFVEWQLGGFDWSDFERYSAMLASAKESARADVLEGAMTAAMRYAAVDTNAIEGIYQVDRGFTRTVATQAAAWEVQMSARGSHVRPAFDDALNGYEYVLDAATHTREVTEQWIKELHAIICASQETYTVHTQFGPEKRPLPTGAYKTMPNSPTLLDGRQHAYAPVMDTAPEMQRLVNELRSESFLSAHPILQAAYAHYAFVCIHPFADGNGRVSRALSSVYLYRSPGVPLIVFADQRNDYYDALEAADGGDPFPFVRFVLAKTLDSIGIIESMLRRSSPPIEKSLSALNELFNSGADVEKLHAIAQRLRNMAMAEARQQFSALPLPQHVRGNVTGGSIRYNRIVPNANTIPPGQAYREIGNDGFFTFHLQSSWPTPFSVHLQIETFMKHDDSAPSELLLASRGDDGLEVWVRELEPVETQALKLKVAAWVEGKIAEVLADAQEQASQGQPS